MIFEEIIRILNTSYGTYWTMSTLSTVMKVYEVCVAMFPILGVRIRFYYDLFTVACINGLPTEEKIVLPMYSSSHLTSMSLSVCMFVCCCCFFFVLFCVFCIKKLEVKFHEGGTGVLRHFQEFHWRDFEGSQQVSSFVLHWSNFPMLCFVGVFARSSVAVTPSLLNP